MLNITNTVGQRSQGAARTSSVVGRSSTLLVVLGCVLLLTTACTAVRPVRPFSAVQSPPRQNLELLPLRSKSSRAWQKHILATRGGGAVETQKGVGPMEIFIQTIKDARRHLAAAAVARSVSIFGMCKSNNWDVSIAIFLQVVVVVVVFLQVLI